jgi:hypothetical protein
MALLPLPRCAVWPPPNPEGASAAEVAAYNTGTYAGALIQFGWDVELRDYTARGLTQGLLWVSRPGHEPGMVRVELHPESQSLRGVWDRCTVVLYGSQVNALTGMVRRNLRRLRDHAGHRTPESVADQEAFLIRLMETLTEAGASNRYDEAEPTRALHAVPDHEETR